MRIQDSAIHVLSRLDDVTGLIASAVWDASEVENRLRDGYRQFIRRTKALFDMKIILNAPAVGDHSALWEEQYMDIFQGIRNYSAFFEKDWADNGVGPIGLSSPFERTLLPAGPHLPGEQLSEQTLEVDRVTFDSVPLSAEYTRGLAPDWTSYEKEGGFPSSFTIDGDGKNFLRLVPQPAGDGTIFDVTYSSDTVEVVLDVSANEVDTTFVDGPVDGVLLDAPGHFPCGEIGVVFDILSENKNTRVEFFRQGLSDEYELPLVCVKYVEFFAMSELLKRNGPGQDLKLSKHYMQRYEIGIRRAERRIEKLQTQEASSFAEAGNAVRVPSNWPANYGVPRDTP